MGSNIFRDLFEEQSFPSSLFLTLLQYSKLTSMLHFSEKVIFWMDGSFQLGIFSYNQLELNLHCSELNILYLRIFLRHTQYMSLSWKLQTVKSTAIIGAFKQKKKKVTSSSMTQLNHQQRL